MTIRYLPRSIHYQANFKKWSLGLNLGPVCALLEPLSQGGFNFLIEYFDAGGSHGKAGCMQSVGQIKAKALRDSPAPRGTV